MTNEPGTTTTAGRRAVQTPAVTADGPGAGGPLWLAAPALAWLVVTLWSALASLRSPGGTALGTIEAAFGLPAVISAALVAGAAAGLAAARLLARGLRVPSHRRPAVRFAVALGSGLLTGVASAATVVLVHDVAGSTIMVLGAVIAAGATIGGALAGVRANAVVAAGVAASLALFLITSVRGLFNDELLNLFGAGATPASLWEAQQRVVWVASVVDGLIVGLIAFAFLRRATRSAATPPRWPAYVVAGGGAGAMLLLTEVITRIGGAPLLDLARSVSEIDDLFQDLAAAARINSALVVLFVGALTAMITFGRTLHPAPEQTDD